MKFKIIMILIFVFLFNTYLFAEKKTNSAVFLRITSSARISAMGGVGNAIFGDVSNTEINPANMHWITNKQIVFSHNEWFEDIRSEYLAYAFPVKNSIIMAVSGKVLSIDDIVKRDSSGVYKGVFGAIDSVYTLSIAKRFSNRFSIGTNLKTIQQKIDTESGSAFAGDIGFLYNTTKFFTFAGGVRNIGSGLAIYEEEFPLPLTYTMGISYYRQGRYILELDAEKEINCDPILRGGIEYFAMKMLDLRAGYFYTKEDYAANGLTLGFGLNFKYKWFLDYAFVPFGDLGNTHRVSLKYNF